MLSFFQTKLSRVACTFIGVIGDTTQTLFYSVPSDLFINNLVEYYHLDCI